MKESPILFSTPMVKAILEGRKTQTRRKLKLPFDYTEDELEKVYFDNGVPVFVKNNGRYESKLHNACPYGKIGDRLYVRETHFQYGHWLKNGFTKTGKQKYKFVCTDKDEDVLFMDNPPSSFRTSIFKTDPSLSFWYKRNGLFMPKKYARIWLENTDVRVERLQDVSEQDAIAEGVESEFFEATECNNGVLGWVDYLTKYANFFDNPIESYKSLWQSINGAESWNLNPWVWVIEFKQVIE